MHSEGCRRLLRRVCFSGPVGWSFLSAAAWRCPQGRHSWRPVPGRHKAAAAFRMAQAVEHSLSPGRVWRLPVVAENVLAVSACLSGGSGRPFGLFCRSDRIFCQPSRKSCLPPAPEGRQARAGGWGVRLSSVGQAASGWPVRRCQMSSAFSSPCITA